MKGSEYECMTNSHETECPSSMYDTQLEFGYCLPSGDDVQVALEKIWEQINEQSSIGTYLVELQNCW
jgi:hypothetical protein